MNRRQILRGMCLAMGGLSRAIYPRPGQARDITHLREQFQQVLDGTAAGVFTVDQLRSLANGKFWQPYKRNPVVPCGREGEFDYAALGTPSVVKVNGVFHMYYETG